MEENIVWENDWAGYMAMDADGKWWEYITTPLKKDLCLYWHSLAQYKSKKIPPSHKPDWEKSLIKRERNNEKQRRNN